MKKIIVKTNEWFDDLPEIKRLLFFIFVLAGSLLVALYFVYAKNFIWAFPIWAGTAWSWRFSYILVKIKERSKKIKNKKLNQLTQK